MARSPLRVTRRRSRAPGWGLLAALGVSLLLLPAAGSAVSITYELDFEFSGAQAPGGVAPWVTATFDDATGDPNSVFLTIAAPGLVGGTNGEYLAEISFNFDPSLDPTLLSFVLVNTVGVVGATTVNTGVNAFMSDGDGDFDIMFDFPPPPGTPSGRFTGGDEVTYEIFYPASIDVGSFDFFSDEGGGQGTFQAAGHVLNTTGAGTGGSGWIGPNPVPEPGALGLLSLGLLGLAVARRERR